MMHFFLCVLNTELFSYMALNKPVNKGGKKSKELPLLLINARLEAKIRVCHNGLAHTETQQ